MFEQGNYVYKPLLLILPLPITCVMTAITTACNTFQCPGIETLIYNPEISLGILFMYIDAVLYMLLGLYFDAVLPQAWGIRKSPWFCLSWMCKPCMDEDTEKFKISELESSSLLDADVVEEKNKILSGESNPKTNPVLIKNLVKIFGNEKVAVKDLFLALQNNECFG